MSTLYGLDKEIQEKLDSKYSVAREQEAREWIESTIGEPLPSDDFHESLKDGVVLCKVIGKLVPGQGKYKESRMPFIQMENIAKFLAGAEALGVPKHNLFQTVDLYEKKNMLQVVDAIFAISRYGYKAGTCNTFLGPKLAEKNEQNFSREQLNASNAVFNTYQYGYNKGANQSGMSFGARREIAGRDPYAQYK
ncbi:calponin homology domain-containing protein [Radiomyces spectabilis]|uniref:calponin homology domain-containing protein n=1 Tax=Radiomyces spectabilis TaxID=64574 RepID=UPI0022209BBB|nr:calponin homology domain-containing protein [Radiomyces spectabilis]KAI8373208.1 calponin homology domain-containing protein [Radiomyces spectabilis]